MWLTLDIRSISIGLDWGSSTCHPYAQVLSLRPLQPKSLTNHKVWQSLCVVVETASAIKICMDRLEMLFSIQSMTPFPLHECVDNFWVSKSVWLNWALRSNVAVHPSINFYQLPQCYQCLNYQPVSKFIELTIEPLLFAQVSTLNVVPLPHHCKWFIVSCTANVLIDKPKFSIQKMEILEVKGYQETYTKLTLHTIVHLWCSRFYCNFLGFRLSISVVHGCMPLVLCASVVALLLL